MGFLGIGGAIGRGAGGVGEQLGAASEGLRKSKLDELMDAIRVQQLRLQIQKQQSELNKPQPYGIVGGPGGSEEGITFDPNTGKFGRQTVIPGYDIGSLSKQADELVNSFPEAVRPIARGVYNAYSAMGKPEEGFKALGTIAGREIAGQGFAPKIEVANGVPFGITRLDSQGKKQTLTPVSEEWTDTDQKMLDQAIAAYKYGQEQKEKLNEERMAIFQKTRLYPAIDKETGEPTYINYQSMMANPGKYGPGTLTQQLKNRVVIFNEINTAVSQLKDSLTDLPEADWNAVGRAQLAYALQSEDPRSSVGQFLQSTAGQALDDKQVAYITAIVNAQESALALRALGGQAGASDMLRTAIIRLLPSASTPTKTYADYQLKRLNSEITQLRAALPKSSSLGIPDTPSTPPPSSGAPPKTAEEYLKGAG